MSTLAKKTLEPLLTVCGLFVMITLCYLSIRHFTMNLSNYPKDPPFAAMAEELTRYLSGRLPMLSSLFTERESAHMVDVLHLFQLGKWVSIATVAFYLIVVPVALCKAPALIGRLQMGMGLFFVFALFLAIWATADFEGWFVAMHKVAFANDLWLLDPRESTLIQMLPIDFFIRAVRGVAIRFLALTAMTTASTVIMRRLSKRSRRPDAME